MKLFSLLVLCQVLIAQGPRILIEPAEVLLGDPVTIRLAGLEPGSEVMLRAQMMSGNRMYASSALFRVSDRGVVDLTRHAPLSGDYKGVDPLGIFWSMQDVAPAGSAQQERDSIVVRFDLSRGEETLARRDFRQRIAANITFSEVREDGLFATFARPEGDGKHPGILVVGGSGGGIGWQRQMAKLFASRGYSALGLAYFAFEELPASLEEIPLEYFESAISWLQKNESVDASRIAVCGVSKGGELALLLGATFDEIRAVVAYVPGSAVFQSIAPNWPSTSSWTRDGEGLPFVPYDLQAATSGADLLEIYEASLKNGSAVALATIPVENTNGPILLLSGRDDTIWPSTAMSEAIVERLQSMGFPHAVQHFPYDDAGHTISRPGYTAMADSTRNGGTAKGNAHASADAWQRVLAFLAEHLRR